MEFQSVQYTVDKLIQWIRTGSLALPDFQRDFVWNPSRVVELLDTVAKQWPIGSLLLLSGPQPFGVRPIESAPPAKESSLDLYVLDGQQRLTSLYHAISDVSDYCYYVDFRALEAGNDDYLKWERRSSFKYDYPSLESRVNRRVALIADVWDLDAFYEWLAFVADPAEQRAYVKLRESRLAGLQAKVYKVMGIQLDQEIQLEALARIFETLNRTGVKLNAFDLIVAIMYPTGFHLRDEWEDVKNSSDLIESFEVDPLELMKLVALLVRRKYGRSAARGVRQGDLLALQKAHIRECWQNAAWLYDKSLNYAREHFGISGSRFVPSWSMILSLAAWLAEEQQAVESSQVARWFWGSAFNQTYAQGANTRVVADFDAVVQGEGGALVEKLYPIDSTVLGQSAKRNGLAMRAFGCLVAKAGGFDPVSGERILGMSQVAFRVYDGQGLRKLNSEDDFSKLVVVSQQTDRLLSRQKKQGLPQQTSQELFASGLRSQFIPVGGEGRELEHFESMLNGVILEGAR